MEREQNLILEQYQKLVWKEDERTKTDFEKVVIVMRKLTLWCRGDR